MAPPSFTTAGTVPGPVVGWRPIAPGTAAHRRLPSNQCIPPTFGAPWVRRIWHLLRPLAAGPHRVHHVTGSRPGRRFAVDAQTVKTARPSRPSRPPGPPGPPGPPKLWSPDSARPPLSLGGAEEGAASIVLGGCGTDPMIGSPARQRAGPSPPALGRRPALRARRCHRCLTVSTFRRLAGLGPAAAAPTPASEPCAQSYASKDQLANQLRRRGRTDFGRWDRPARPRRGRRRRRLRVSEWALLRKIPDGTAPQNNPDS